MSMRELLQKLERPRRPAPAIPATQPVLVYGAGNRGKQVAGFLQTRGHDVVGFADAAAAPGASWQGLPIRTLAGWQAQGALRDFCMVVAIHNRGVNMPPLLAQLAQAGAARLVNPVEFQTLYEGQFPDAYWLAGPESYRDHGASLERLAALLADETSRELLRRVLDFRLGGDYAALPDPRPKEQYCPADLPRWPEALRFIDGGAYDGDSLRHLKRHGYEFERIAAFEPDPANFSRLAQCVEALGGGICLPCALGKTSGAVRFAQEGTEASRITEEGGQIVSCVALDEALPGFRPNLIKLDVEGAEPEALQGAARTIAAIRPGLALSIYHHPTHLWQIPLLLDDWRLGYRFHLRLHGYSSFDLILYAVVQRS